MALLPQTWSPSRGRAAERPQSSPPARSRCGPGAGHLRRAPGTPAEPEGEAHSRPSTGPASRPRSTVRGKGPEPRNETPPRATRGPACAHTNGHEVREDDDIPQVVEVAVAEQELRAPQERGLILGLWRVLGEHMLRIRAAPLILGPDVPPPDLCPSPSPWKSPQTQARSLTWRRHHSL